MVAELFVALLFTVFSKQVISSIAADVADECPIVAGTFAITLV